MGRSRYVTSNEKVRLLLTMCTGPRWSYICHRTSHSNRLLSETITLLALAAASLEMGAYHPHKHKTSPKGSPGYFVPKPVCAWLVFGFLSLALLHIICCSPSTNQDSVFSPLIQYLDDTYSFVSTEYVLSMKLLIRSSHVHSSV